jgi:predicted RNA methylase
MVTRTNGFFSRALDSAQNYTNDLIRQQLALHMGQSVSFVLTNHRDVGSLYEKAIIELPNNLNGNTWGDLNRHYTPIKVAERMLELLPLERIRPEERFIFDPAAGSGSLLLAATARLAQMSDIPSEGELRRDYLASHVIGNDLDRDVNLITQLRYFLATESIGIDDFFPSPNFHHENYESFNKENIAQKIGHKPRIVIANPPFEIRGDKQLAFEFVKQATNWLDEGSQFAFILPSSFISGKNYGALDIRKSLSENCKLFEVCRYPEGTIGIDARQDVSILIGEIGQTKNSIYSISRSVISRAESSEIRENGYLGASQIIEINSNGDWSGITTTKIILNIPTIPLSNIFFIFNGVKHRSGNSPVENPPTDRPYKRTWQRTWVRKNSIWADPERVNPMEKWIVYDKLALEGLRFQSADLFDKSKILVGRIANIASNKSLTAQIDTTGFCPNTSIWCILPIQEVRRTKEVYQSEDKPQNWDNLNFEQQKLWLLGILISDLAVELSMNSRGNVTITGNILKQFPLPLIVDPQIIDITDQMVKRDQNREAIPDQDPLRQELNLLVEKSYGNPTWIKRQRTGKSPELEAWKLEQEIKKTKTAIGQVLEISGDNTQVYMYISRLMDDDETEGEWIPLPQELPGWALDGTPFEVELSHDIKTFEQLRERPWALRKFVHEPRAYLTGEELDEFLSIPELEVLS